MLFLFFYPANFTSVSFTKLIKLSHKISKFRKLSIQILVILVDSPFSPLHCLVSKLTQSELDQLNFPLI